MHYFAAGYHDIGPEYPVKNGEKVFLEPGAFLEGSIRFLSGDRQSIEGRGVIYGAKYETFNPSFP